MIGKFEFDEFRLVEKMTFRVIESTTSPVQVLELHMHTDRRDRAARIRLRFIGVANLKIDSWPPGQVTLAGFEIFDISEHQLEGLAWRVSDYEERAIDFFCKEVGIVSASLVNQG